MLWWRLVTLCACVVGGAGDEGRPPTRALPPVAVQHHRVVVWAGGWGWKRGPMWIYAPAVDTIVEGFRAAAAMAGPANNVSVTSGYGDWPRFEREVAAATAGDIFVYVGIVDLREHWFKAREELSTKGRHAPNVAARCSRSVC
jgi:hypothetical protein